MERSAPGPPRVAERRLAAAADPLRRNRAGYTPAEAATLRPLERVHTDGERFELGIQALDRPAPLEAGTLVRVHGLVCVHGTAEIERC